MVTEGTDLTVGVEGRTWIPCDGKENFPDGEVFTGPVETSVEGHVRFSFPAPHAGRLVRDIELRFEGGEVVEAHASEARTFSGEMLAMDEGARRLGEFAFGMNDSVQEFTGHTLFDEKLGGTVHMALGKAYPESGGTNESALHWDLVCDLRGESEVHADGELVYRNGEFLPGSVLIALLGDTHLRAARALSCRLPAAPGAADATVHTGDFTAASVLADLEGFGPVVAGARKHGRRRAPPGATGEDDRRARGHPNRARARRRPGARAARAPARALPRLRRHRLRAQPHAGGLAGLEASGS